MYAKWNASIFLKQEFSETFCCELRLIESGKIARILGSERSETRRHQREKASPFGLQLIWKEEQKYNKLVETKSRNRAEKRSIYAAFCRLRRRAFSAAVSAASLFIRARRKGPNSRLLVFGGGIIVVMNTNCRDRCAGESDADKSGEWVASNGTNDELSLDFLSPANRSRFMTARDCRRYEYRFACGFRVTTTIFSRQRRSIMLRMSLKRRREWFRIGFWIKSPFAEEIKKFKSISLHLGKHSALLVTFSSGTCSIVYRLGITMSINFFQR